MTQNPLSRWNESRQIEIGKWAQIIGASANILVHMHHIFPPGTRVWGFAQWSLDLVQCPNSLALCTHLGMNELTFCSSWHLQHITVGTITLCILRLYSHFVLGGTVKAIQKRRTGISTELFYFTKIGEVWGFTILHNVVLDALITTAFFPFNKYWGRRSWCGFYIGRFRGNYSVCVWWQAKICMISGFDYIFVLMTFQ